MSDIPIDAIADKLDEAAKNAGYKACLARLRGLHLEEYYAAADAEIFRAMAALLRPDSARLPAQDDPAERLPAKDEPVTSEADYVRSRGWRHG